MAGFGKKYFGKQFPKREEEHRINRNIRTAQVRVIMGEEQLGVIATDRALKIAQDNNLDLVEVAPEARPPVCKIMDYSKFKYEQKIKKKEAVKKQRESKVDLKELRLRPGIQDNDIETKVNQAKKFIEDGDKVQFNLRFKGAREMCHKEQGFEVMHKIIQSLSEISDVEKEPKLDGNKIICILTPKNS
jgi:translation initiation factor IF-3